MLSTVLRIIVSIAESPTPAIIRYLYGTRDPSSAFTLFAPRCGIGQKKSSSENEGADPGAAKSNLRMGKAPRSGDPAALHTAREARSGDPQTIPL